MKQRYLQTRFQHETLSQSSPGVKPLENWLPVWKTAPDSLSRNLLHSKASLATRRADLTAGIFNGVPTSKTLKQSNMKRKLKGLTITHW